MTPVRPVALQASELTIRTLAWRFEEVLRLGDGTGAEAVVDDALAGGLAPEAVQSLVIAPAMARPSHRRWPGGAQVGPAGVPRRTMGTFRDPTELLCKAHRD
jgi:hypothetical protein